MKKTTFFLGFSLITTSCFQKAPSQVGGVAQCNNQDDTYKKYQKCDLTNLKDYYTTLVGDETKNDKIILWLTGGPSIASPVKQLWNDQVLKRYFPEIIEQNKIYKEEKIAYLFINQAQWMKQKQINYSKLYRDFEEEFADKENEETIDIAHKLVLDFIKKGKKVILGGSSFGGYLINLYLAKYGDAAPTHIISQAGRLNLGNKNNIFDFQGYVNLGYDDQIINKTPIDLSNFPKDWSEKKADEFRSSYKFTRSFMDSVKKHDYTQMIKDEDLSKVTFLSAQPDHHVGWLSQKERDWARNRGANVAYYTTAQALKYFNNYKNVFGQVFNHIQGKTIRTFAHIVGSWDLDQFRKYYIAPFNK